MRVAIIGRTEWLYETAKLLIEAGHEIKLVVTSKEMPEYKVTAEDYRILAKRVNCPFIYTPRINEFEIISQIKAIGEIDIAISINYSGVIGDDVINLFKFGILNAHGGDLPKYRGNACQAWAIINGENRIGLCIHKMIGGELDSGPIIEREYFPININSRIGEVYEWVEKTIPILMCSAVEKLSKNSNYVLEIQSLDPKDALRCYPRKPQDGKIDWNQGDTEIIRLVNASSEPYSGAFCLLDGERVTIWRAELFESSELYLAVPGQIAFVDKEQGYIIVITGSGKIKITEVEQNHSGRVRPAEIITSIRKRLE